MEEAKAMTSVSGSTRSKLVLLPTLAVLICTAQGSASAQANPMPRDSTKVQQPSVNGSGKTAIRYGADFFAEKNPKTAFDMVNLLPGFTFSPGTYRSEGTRQQLAMCSSTANAFPTNNLRSIRCCGMFPRIRWIISR